MATTRITSAMRRSLERRVTELDDRIAALGPDRTGDDSAEATAFLAQLTRERDDILEALDDAVLVDDEPFDTEAIEIGDTVTVRDDEGEIERYLLVDASLRSRPRADWVSVSSPLGAALLGRNKGEKVRVESPAGASYYLIVAFERAEEEGAGLNETARPARDMPLPATGTG